MSHSFTPSIKPYVISSLYESMKATRPAMRQASTAYSLGAQVANANMRYICIQEGVTSTGAGPTNATGAVYDGTVRWLPTGQDNVQDGDIIANIYLGLGMQTEWPNPASPPAPDVSENGQKEVLDNLTSLVKLDASNFRLGLKNNVWETGTIYSQYSPEVASYPTPNYVIVGGTFIYKCLDNNGGAESTEAPSGNSSALVETSDGYVWKYVGSIAGSEMFTYGSTEFVPAPTDVDVVLVPGEVSTFGNFVATSTPFDASDSVTVQVVGSGVGCSAAIRSNTSGSTKTVTGVYATAGGINYDSDTYAIVKLAGATGDGATANPTIIDGEITSISIVTPGTTYTDAAVVILGDGTGATATATVSGGMLVSVDIDTPGSGYTWAKAFVIPGVSGGAAIAKLSPAGGHGSNLDTELGIASLLVSARLSANLIDYVPTEPVNPDGTFRQISLVSGVKGSVKNSLAFLGPIHPDYVSGSQAKYTKGSGFVLYLNNISAITHTSSQEEVIKISISL